MKHPSIWLSSAILILLAAVFGFGVYEWCCCRFYVPPGYMAVITAKSGAEPKPGSILVERGERGIWRETLAEGRHFLDMMMYDVSIVPSISIPIGKVGVVTSKVGKPLPPGEILAPDESYQGIWKKTLGPGLYRMNPQGYSVELVDAVNVPIGYVGVVTSQTGHPAARDNFAAPGEKGVLRDILQPGLYYINPRAYQVNIIEIGMNQVSMTGREGSVIEVKRNISSASAALKQLELNTFNQQLSTRSQYISKESDSKAMRRRESVQKSRMSSNMAEMTKKMDLDFSDNIVQNKRVAQKQGKAPNEVVYSINSFVEFPSRDGFKILMDMTVEFELLPESVSLVYMLYGDLPQVVDKIILPQVLSISRLKGSSYKAQDFIMGEGRETFQNNLRSDLVSALRDKHILVRNAIIRNVAIPQEILRPIQDSSVAYEQNLTNCSLQETAKIEAELNNQTSLVEQKRREVEQETLKMVAEIKANRSNAVRIINANTSLEVARLQLKRAAIDAQREQLVGETTAKANFIRDNETALGIAGKAAVLGVKGILADLKFVENLNPRVDLRVIYAGQGTLWTDMKSGSIVLPQTK